MHVALANHTVLIVEDDADTRNYLEVVVRCLGYCAEIAEDGGEALAILHAKPGISLVLCGFETLREIRKAGQHQPVILLSSTATTNVVVQAMKAGATDFLAKPVSHEDLGAAMRKALQAETLAPCADSLTESWITKDMRMAWRRVAASDVPLLIEGETGAGKEVLARQIHANSPRMDKPFLKLNCAALPGELVESELFGYERGAFTGAFTSKPGKFEQAQGGTILLDEIGDMDVRLQAKLLHVLQDKECARLGGKDSIALDVRVMAATHCDLAKAMDEGRFRADLYYRLNVVCVRVPPLREHKEDLPDAAEFFLHKHRTEGSPAGLLSPELRQAMLQYDWPGNLRELENMMRRLLVMQDAGQLARQLVAATGRRSGLAASADEGSLPDGVIRFQPAGAASSGGFPSLEKVNEAKRKAEMEAILRALDASRWNRKQAAKILRIDYKALLYKMRKLEIEPAGSSLRTAAGGA